MTLDPARLAETLDTNIENTDNEAAAIDAFVTAFSEYFEDAEALAVGAGIPINAAAFGPLEIAMKAALQGISNPNQAAVKIPLAVVAWWTAAIPLFAVLFQGATAMTPPTGVIPPLQPTFDANRDGNVSKTDALRAIAEKIHLGNSGATVTIPPGGVLEVA